jgi:hypothetical protein
MTATLEIKTKDFTVKNLSFPDHLIYKVSSNPMYVEVKKDLEEIFTVFFHSDEFKSCDDTDNYRMLHYSFNQLLDDMFLGIHHGRMNHVQEQLDKINNPVQVEPTKEVLN